MGSLVEPPESNVTQDVYRQMQYTQRHYYLPTDILGDYAHESSQLSSTKGYDPRVSSLLAQGVVLADAGGELLDDPCRAVAFAHGSSGTTLAVASFDQEKNDTGTDVIKLGTVARYEFGSTLEQIEFADPEPSCSPFVLVKYRGGVSLVDVKSIDGRMQTGAHTKLASDDYMHCSINPWSWTEIGGICKNGSIALWDVSEGVREKLRLHSSHKNASSLSVWHKMVWASDVNTALVAGRKEVSLCDLRAGSERTTLLSPSIGQVCDISRSKINDYEAFVLTSDQVVWYDTRQPTKALLSWDHYIHSRDPSLKMATAAVDDTSVVALYSQLVGENVIYQFGYDDQLPISCDDPHSFRSPPDVVTQSMVLCPLESEDDDAISMVVLRLSADYGLTGQILSTVKGEGAEFDGGLSDASSVAQSSDMDSEDDDSKDFLMTADRPRDSFAVDFSQWYQLLYQEWDKGEELSSLSIVSAQDLATQLSSAIRDFFEDDRRDIVSLADLVSLDVLSRTLDLKPADMWAMLSQLQVHYNDSKITVKYPPLAAVFDKAEVATAGDLYKYLMSLWVHPLPEDDKHIRHERDRRERVVRRFANLAMISLLNVSIDRDEHAPEDDANNGVLHPVLRHQQPNRKNQKLKLQPTTLKLVDEWDIGGLDRYSWVQFGRPRPEAEPEEPTTPRPSSRSSLVSSMTAMSSSNMASMSPSQELTALMQSTGIEASQGVRLGSQAPSSQRASQRASQRSQRSSQRSKKRRNEGFV